ncbi:phenylalanine--tRNA ligase subunit beta [Moheibacter lacus]|uniref:Phenylalanine--tRNA ligase beta subunit n=1 Tax=Moheibacter lacus TaxID=2745851 RepID=A0A838ZS00_9FLAO|nr:phenylalanine--tRNA ligase subunit beta [Moheibacter lacus]MBA5629762.1 phenylalanine--tRNA ligase subunit beta [Moheibacter lacus]
MKISYNWLSTYIKTDLEVQKIGEILTNTGLEVESIEKTGTQNQSLEGVVVGKVMTLEKHPNADKLQIATVDVGTTETLQIVCGAPNIAEEQKVPVATVGTVLTSPDGKSFTIKEAKLRNVASFGMICSEAELGVSENHDGIWVLEPSHKVGTPISEIIKKPSTDTLIEIGLTPNRTDAMSHFGVARDLNAALNVLKLKSELIALNSNEEFDQIKTEGKNPIQIEIKNPELVPRYAGIYLENLTIKPSPNWLQDRLKTIGLNPINNVVDITNYILHDLGQPLHAFDADKISGNKIIVQTLERGSKFKTLEGVERELNGSELMICDDKQGMCIAGVYGGIDSGVTESTNKIFLESAYFDPITVRKTSKSHGLNTDSSFRFERGVDPNMTIQALKKAVVLLVELADAKVVGEIFDHYPTPIENFKTVLRYHKLDQLLGERLHREQVKGILESLDIQVISESNETLELSIPPYRADVQREVDVIEEILRIYGYNKIKTPEKIAFTPVKNLEKNAQRVENVAAQTLISLGFHEAMNNSVVKAQYQEIFGLDESTGVKLLNPLSSDLSVMRQSMLPGLLENTAYNINRKNSDLKFFEFGKIYNKTDSGYQENYQLAILLSGNKSAENWANPTVKSNFFTLKGVVTEVLTRLGITEIKEIPYTNSNYAEAISLQVDGKELGVLGICSKGILKKMDVGQEIFYAEFNWDLILELVGEFQLKFKDIPKFPAVKRDLALLIDKGISYSELFTSAQNLKLELMKSVQLFDVYEGDKLPEGKKSYALSFILQDEEKTLGDAEIEKTMNELIRNFQTNFNAELRN